MPPLSAPRRRRLLVLVAFASLLLPVFAAGPVDAHGNKWGAAGRGQGTKFDAGIVAYDVLQDGHCAKGRLHLGGRWRVLTTDCTHSPKADGVSSAYYSASGSVSASACINSHGYNSTTCHYGSFVVPWGGVNLGNRP